MEVLDGHYLVDDSDSDCSSKSDQWEFEGLYDPISLEERKELEEPIEGQIADLYWAMRRVVGRFRAATSTSGPRRQANGGSFNDCLWIFTALGKASRVNCANVTFST